MKETTLLFHMDGQLSVCAELGKMNSASPHGVSKMYIFLSQSGLRTTATLFSPIWHSSSLLCQQTGRISMCLSLSSYKIRGLAKMVLKFFYAKIM